MMVQKFGVNRVRTVRSVLSAGVQMNITTFTSALALRYVSRLYPGILLHFSHEDGPDDIYIDKNVYVMKCCCEMNEGI
jgi:hypothetical protein